MEEASDLYLIVGIGNPGSGYADTRHNVGFQVVQEFARRFGISLRKEASLQAVIGKGALPETGQKVIVIMPLTYVNLSGEAVLAALRYYRIKLDNLIVVSDEVALPFGKLRLSDKGSAGGHNGLKDIEAKLGTQYYARLRFGVGDRENGELADHVLGKFTEDEKKRLPPFVEQAAEVLYIWVTKGSEPAKRATSPQEDLKS